jgi:general secretion pathway protein I
MNMRRQQGFTLMEAIVALVLIATTGMALFSWVNSNVIALQRVQASNARDAATANALQYMQNVNPMATPEGDVTLGEYSLSWKAQLLTEPRDGTGYPFGRSLYQLAMYQTLVRLQTSDGKDWFDFKLQQVGYKRVRDVRPPF